MSRARSLGPLAEILRQRQRKAMERFGLVKPQLQPEHDADELWRELVAARRDAALARADLEAIEAE